jgi:hypothetical protein
MPESWRTNMSVNFNISQKNLSKEVNQCIALYKMDTLLSFCNSCTSNILPRRINPECQACKITYGIQTIVSARKRQEREAEDLVGIG